MVTVLISCVASHARCLSSVCSVLISDMVALLVKSVDVSQRNYEQRKIEECARLAVSYERGQA
jgi:hypothetical protein